MKNILNIIGLMLLTATVGSAQGIFSAMDTPTLPGERRNTVEIELRGLQPNQVTVDCIYSMDSMEVVRSLKIQTKTGREPSAKAKVTSIGNDKIRATMIFPHRDHSKPNSTDRNAKIINNPSKVFYAWTRSHIPAGASSELTLSSEVRSFAMPRLLIIAYMGDSYASGEGAPNSNVPGTSWTESDCHRSEKSGGMLAIKKLIAEHPEWGIRYKNTTCSGATLSDFTESDLRNRPLGGIDWSKPAQFKQLQEWMERNNRNVVDILLTDGGGNDVGFAPVATSALTTPSVFVGNISNDDAVKDYIRHAMSDLANRYDVINNKIQSEEYGFEVGRVIWFNYPNPMTDANGRLCSPGTNGNNPFDCWGVSERQISDADMRYIRDVVFLGMNGEVKKAVDKHGWDFVDVANRALNHGLCNCDEPYFNTLGQAITIQGDPKGTMHPNATGFRKIYRDPLFSQLERSIGLWHADLKKDARALAIARAKAKARAKAEREAMMRLVQTNTTLPRQVFTVPGNLKTEKVKVDTEDQKSVQPDKDDD